MLHRNNLTYIPSSIKMCTQLERVKLDRNMELKVANDGAVFRSMTKLTVLTIDNYVFDQFDDETKKWCRANVGTLRRNGKSTLSSILEKAQDRISGLSSSSGPVSSSSPTSVAGPGGGIAVT